MGRDINKLKAKGGNGKFKYMPEKEMLELAAKFSPYRYVLFFLFAQTRVIWMWTLLICHYRSLFMWYMWRVEGVDIAVLNA